MKLAIVGLGYVGTTNAACLPQLGHEIVGIDVVPEKVTIIASGRSPVVEPGLDKLLFTAREQGRLRATMDLPSALDGVDAALICIGTPSTRDEGVDISNLRQTVQEVAQFRRRTGQTITCIVRSTALPDHHREMMMLLQDVLRGEPIAYCVHPEFLRAGQAVNDFIEPPMIIFGCSDSIAEMVCRELYPNFAAKTVYTEPAVAAFTKYACNCFHAVKITFANEMGILAHAMGVDSRAVMKLLCLDAKLNISEKYLQPGFAFGGSCIPKDLRGLLHYAHRAMKQVPMLAHVLVSNKGLIEGVLREILHKEPKRVGMIGVTFKDKTDDLRESPMVELAERLSGRGIDVRIFDPNLCLHRIVGDNKRWALKKLPHIQKIMVAEARDAVAGCECVVLARYFPQVDYEGLPWASDQYVLDLHGENSYPQVPVPVQGLAWPMDKWNEAPRLTNGHTTLLSGVSATAKTR